MKKKKKTMEERMKEAEIIIQNMQKQPFSKWLKPYGFDEARTREIEELYREVRGLMKEQESAYREQYEATRKLKEQAKIAADYFTKYAVIVRRVIGNDKSWHNILGISGRRKKAFTSWTFDAETFYTRTICDPDIMANLRPYGVTTATLEKGLTMIEKIQALHSCQLNKRGLAQVATPRKNKKMKELFKWISEILFCAGLAFEDKPNMLVQLRVPVVEKSIKNPSTEHQSESPVNGAGEERLEPQRTAITNPSQRVLKIIPIFLSVVFRDPPWQKIFCNNSEKLPDAA
jgi:hypothetical protein